MNLPQLVLLAGGASSRFSPLREKNLFKFLGKTLVERQIEAFRSAGFVNILIVASDENYQLIKLEALKVDRTVKVVLQVGDGQAGAVMSALKDLDLERDVLIANMNDIYDAGLLQKFMAFLTNQPNAMQPTSLVNGQIAPVTNSQPTQLSQPSQPSQPANALVGFFTETYFPGGYLKLDGDRIVQVIEKPGAGNEPSQYVRIVFDYFRSAKKLGAYLSKAASIKDDVYEVALSNMMNNGEPFQMIKHDGVWRTIKYPWHVLSMMEYYLSLITQPVVSPNAQIASSAKIIGNVIIEDGAKVFDNAVVRGPAYIGKNSIVANNALVRDSHIGDNCVVGFATEVARSYVSDSCWFHTNYIGDSVLGKNVSLGSGAVTANLRLDEQTIKVNVKEERIDTGLTKFGNIIGDNVRIGVNVSLSPGIKVGSGSFIGSGVLIDEDIDNGKFITIKQEKLVKMNKFDIAQTSRENLKSKL